MPEDKPITAYNIAPKTEKKPVSKPGTKEETKT